MEMKPKFALLIPKDGAVKISSASNYATISFRIVEHSEQLVLRNPGSDHEYNDLEFSAQFDIRGEARMNHAYGFNVRYKDVYQVELRTAKRMYNMLSRIEKLESKWTISPATFGQWLALQCEGLKLSAVRESRHSRGMSSYSENEYNQITLRDLQYAADQLITDTLEKATA